MRSRGLILGFCALALAAGCSGPKGDPSDKSYGVRAGDDRMNWAMATARSTAPTFIAALKAPTASQTAFAVKMRFDDDGKTEYMWLVPVTYDGSRFHGRV